MRNKKYPFVLLFILASTAILLNACGGTSSDTSSTGERKDPVTPVTFTTCTVGTMQEEVQLNAISTFLKKNIVRAFTNGYLNKVNIQLGEKVQAGSLLFIQEAKEAKNLGNTISTLDSTLNYTGLIRITANAGGFVTAIEHQYGDYVQEGDPLAEISDAGSLVFLLQLPYELRPLLAENKSVSLILPDRRILRGTVSSSMPVADMASQTQSIQIKIAGDSNIPENIIAQVNIIKAIKTDAVSLPKEAVLTDETQQYFWIMKMTNSHTAVKVPVTKGITSAGRVEILSPVLSPRDSILLTGNYGLPDTARVVIEQPKTE